MKLVPKSNKPKPRPSNQPKKPANPREGLPGRRVGGGTR